MTFNIILQSIHRICPLIDVSNLWKIYMYFHGGSFVFPFRTFVALKENLNHKKENLEIIKANVATERYSLQKW